MNCKNKITKNNLSRQKLSKKVNEIINKQHYTLF